MTVHWKLLRRDPRNRSVRADLPVLIERLLSARGLSTAEEVSRFLSPDIEQLEDPFLLPDMREAVDRVEFALRRGERIFVFGDYDVDGLASAEMLRRQLLRLGHDITLRVPERLGEGYGLSVGAVLEARACGAGLILTADCGTNSAKEIALARELGLDTIVLDHHQPQGEPPPACAIVNPWLPRCRARFRDLCAGGVVLKFLSALGGGGHAGGVGTTSPSPFDLLDYAALACIADNVPLLGDNRILVCLGMESINKSPRPCLRSLLRVAGKEFARIGTRDLSYHVIPRLNAAGRMGDVARASRLLGADDPEECSSLAGVLEQYNERRKHEMRVVMDEAAAEARMHTERHAGGPLVLASDRWHVGVLGIVASRLAAETGESVILLAADGDVLRGSGRAAEGQDLLVLLQRAAQHLKVFGGHSAAVGLTLEPGRLEAFRSSLGDAASLSAAGSQGDRSASRALAVDDRADLAEMNWTLTEWLRRLEPFGRDHPEPVWGLCGRVSAARVLKEQHLKFDLTSTGTRVECIGFGLADRAPQLSGWRGDVHVAAALTRDSYRGEDRVQLVVKDISLEDPFGHA